jgi:periplasmic divalent cation tolerance protein
MGSKTIYCMAYMTAGNAAEARRIGRALVREELAACVNVLGPIESVYRWKGRVEKGREAVFIAKTRVALQKKLVARVRTLHSYECPCVVFLPISGGDPSFLKWIGESTGSRR